MLLQSLTLLCLLLPTGPELPAGNLVRVEFSGVIRTTAGDPFGQPYEHWRNQPVSGYFLYDPATPNALTPKQVKRKRTARISGKKSKRTFKHQTKHAYLQNLSRPSFELDLPGHKVVGSRRSLIKTKYRELDTTNSQFRFIDGRGAWVEFRKRQQHGCLKVDGESMKNAGFQLHFFDKGQKMANAELPERFPFVLGSDLILGANLDLGGKGILFEIKKLSWRVVSR